MTKQYDAKKSVLAAYPNNKKAGVQLFQEIMQCSEDDFEYEEGVNFEKYIYGDVGGSSSESRSPKPNNLP